MPYLVSKVHRAIDTYFMLYSEFFTKMLAKSVRFEVELEISDVNDDKILSIHFTILERTR